MVYEIVLPQLGLSMDSGKIVKWLFESGDLVNHGDIMLEIESDKSVVEIEAVRSGSLQILKDHQDGEIAVGEVIGYLLAEGEEVPQNNNLLQKKLVVEQDQKDLTASTELSILQDTLGKSKTIRPPSSPAARRRAMELGVDWRLATGSGPNGRIKEIDVIRYANSLNEDSRSSIIENISPVAKRIAEDMGLDHNEIYQRFPNERIERIHIEQIIREKISISSVAPSRISGAPAIPHTQRALDGVRQKIADRMLSSTQNTAPVTLSTEADATTFVNIRKTLQNVPDIPSIPSYNAMLAKIVAKGLREFPEINSSLSKDKVLYWETINIGIAVDTPRGLIVPVVKDVQTKNLWDLWNEMSTLQRRASEGKALPDDLVDSTFTITNLGMYEIDVFTPIINQPECAILGVGRFADKLVVIQGDTTIRTMVFLSLTFDHRIIDGALAARFLQRVKQLIELPYLWWDAPPTTINKKTK